MKAIKILGIILLNLFFGEQLRSFSTCFNGNISYYKFQMQLGSILENKTVEKRLAITPEIAKKYISLGFKLSLPNGYGVHLGFNDEEYKNLGVNFLNNEKDIINNSEIIIQLGLPDDEKLSLLKENQTLIGSLNAFLNKEKLDNLKKKN